MSDPNPPASGNNKGSQQLNKLLGANTVDFHLQFAPPGLKKAKANVELPFPGALSSSGGTPNQKAERVANRIAFFHFVQPDQAQAQSAVSNAIGFFQGQLETGHQCIFNADEALTASHSPIWWRAITSLRITSNALAGRGGDYATLESVVLDWIQFHTSLNSLGEIPSGPNAGKVLLPGSRWKGGPNTDPHDPAKACFCVMPDVKDPLTDSVNNIIYQMIKTGAVPPGVPKKVVTLREEAPDLAGVALAKQILDSGVGFGDATTFRLPQLRSRLVVERFPNGHRARFPDGMPRAAQPALEAWTEYETGQMCMSYTLDGCPPPSLTGDAVETTVEAVPLGANDQG